MFDDNLTKTSNPIYWTCATNAKDHANSIYGKKTTVQFSLIYDVLQFTCQSVPSLPLITLQNLNHNNKDYRAEI